MCERSEQNMRKQDGLQAVLTLDEALHLILQSGVVEILTHEGVFTQPRPEADMAADLTR